MVNNCIDVLKMTHKISNEVLNRHLQESFDNAYSRTKFLDFPDRVQIQTPQPPCCCFTLSDLMHDTVAQLVP